VIPRLRGHFARNARHYLFPEHPQSTRAKKQKPTLQVEYYLMQQNVQNGHRFFLGKLQTDGNMHAPRSVTLPVGPAQFHAQNPTVLKTLSNVLRMKLGKSHRKCYKRQGVQDGIDLQFAKKKTVPTLNTCRIKYVVCIQFIKLVSIP
jgi:hypothetical protein